MGLAGWEDTVFVLFCLTWFSFEAYRTYKRVHGLWKPAMWPSLSLLQESSRLNFTLISLFLLFHLCTILFAWFCPLCKWIIQNVFLCEHYFFFEIYPCWWCSCSLFLFIIKHIAVWVHDHLFIYHRRPFELLVIVIAILNNVNILTLFLCANG